MTPQEDDTEYGLSFDIETPESARLVQGLLAQLATDNDVYRVSIEVRSTTPLSIPGLLPDQVTSAETDTEPLTESSSTTAAEATESASTTPTPVQQDETTSADVADGAEPTEDDDGTDEEETTKDADDDDADCEYCGEEFENERQLSGHLRWCDAYQDHKSADAEANTDTDAETGTATDTDESPVDEAAEKSLTPGTNAFQVASVLQHTEGALTSKDLAAQVSDTAWELTSSRLSTTLGNLYQDGLVTRKQRHTDQRGKNPYEYQLNEVGRTVIADAEEQARANEEDTFETLTSESEAAEITGTLTAGTKKYHAASVLSLTTEPVTAGEVFDLLEGTDWESSRSAVSADLGDLYRDGFADRDTRDEASGNPYEYTLTEAGRERVNQTIADATDDEAQPLSEVLKPKLSDDDEEDESDDETGLDALFNDEAPEEAEIQPFDNDE